MKIRKMIWAWLLALGIALVGRAVAVETVDQTPEIQWLLPEPIVFGTPVGDRQLDASADTAGTFAYSPTNGTVLPAGTNLLSVVFTPDDLDNYGSATSVVSVVVLPAPLTITVNDTVMTYGGGVPALSVSYNGLVNGDTDVALDILPTIETSATSLSPVGTYAITASGASATNYDIVYVPGTLTVNPAPLTFIAYNATRPAGMANPMFTGTITGLQNADNITAAYSSAATPASPPGTYPIVPTPVDPDTLLGNYLPIYVNGSLVLTIATPTLVWDSPTNIIYGTALSDAQLNATANTAGTFTYNIRPWRFWRKRLAEPAFAN